MFSWDNFVLQREARPQQALQAVRLGITREAWSSVVWGQMCPENIDMSPPEAKGFSSLSPAKSLIHLCNSM